MLPNIRKNGVFLYAFSEYDKKHNFLIAI